MHTGPSRREVLALATLAGVGGATLGYAQRQRPPALADDLVRDFVGAAHGDFEKVKSMLAEHPGLLNATWDWGGGDFESAIGGAGHMGRADIAEFLISKGARFEVHVAAMLGQLAAVKAILEANPAARTSPGPHGITLVRHAEMGGERARPVLDYLKAEGH